MGFASVVLLAFFLGGATQESTKRRQPVQLVVDFGARPTPLNLIRRPPVELKSFKVVGATGLGAFIPIATNAALGAGASTFRVGPGHCALQLVAGLRLRF